MKLHGAHSEDISQIPKRIYFVEKKNNVLFFHSECCEPNSAHFVCRGCAIR